MWILIAFKTEKIHAISYGNSFQLAKPWLFLKCWIRYCPWDCRRSNKENSVQLGLFRWTILKTLFLWFLLWFLWIGRFLERIIEKLSPVCVIFCSTLFHYRILSISLAPVEEAERASCEWNALSGAFHPVSNPCLFCRVCLWCLWPTACCILIDVCDCIVVYLP